MKLRNDKEINALFASAYLGGYGRDAIPSYENSHRLHRYAQIRRQKRNLKICGHL